MTSPVINKINLELSLYGFSVIYPEENKSKNNYLKKFQDEMKNIKLEPSCNNQYPVRSFDVSEEKINNDETFCTIKN